MSEKNWPIKTEIPVLWGDVDSFGHVRYFENSNQVRERYSHLFNDFDIQTIYISKPYSLIYLCSGIKC